MTVMTDEAAYIYERGRQSTIDSDEAWDRLEELAATADWDTSWLDEHDDTSLERSHRRD